MTAIFKILLNVIKRRIKNGEILLDVIRDYPKLTAKEIIEIKKHFNTM